jgi:hypothetical protein
MNGTENLLAYNNSRQLALIKCNGAAWSKADLTKCPTVFRQCNF